MKKFYLLANDEKILELSFVQSLKEKSVIVEDRNEATDFLVLGGDGAMLDAVGDYHGAGLPFCGINFGHIGFLMNEKATNTLREVLEGQTRSVKVRLLKAKLYDQGGRYLSSALAFNDFYFERATSQTARFIVRLDETVLFDPLDADGIIVCTAAGSTAYNASAGGVILFKDIEAMVLTGICPAVYHGWRSTPLPPSSNVMIEALELEKRPVRFMADGREIPEAKKAVIEFSKDSFVEIKYAKSQDYREKVLKLIFNQKAGR